MKRLPAAAMLLAVGACVTAKIEQLSPNTYPPIPPEHVTVFMSPDELRADTIQYERIAMIFTKGSAEFTDNQKHLRKAREEAAKLGANGIIIQGTEPGGRYNWFWGTSSNREQSIMAIRWNVIPPDARQPPP